MGRSQEACQARLLAPAQGLRHLRGRARPSRSSSWSSSCRCTRPTSRRPTTASSAWSTSRRSSSTSSSTSASTSPCRASTSTTPARSAAARSSATPSWRGPSTRPIILGLLIAFMPKLTPVAHGARRLRAVLRPGHAQHLLHQLERHPVHALRLDHKPWLFTGFMIARVIIQVSLSVLLVVVLHWGIYGVLVGDPRRLVRDERRLAAHVLAAHRLSSSTPSWCAR